MASATQKEGGDGLPDDVDGGEALSQLIVPAHLTGFRFGLVRSSIARSYNHLRAHPSEGVTPPEFGREIFDGSRLERELRMTSGAWFAEYVAPYLPRLPGVRREGSTWTFDPSSAEREPVPETVRAPTEDAADVNLREFDFPGRVPQHSISNYQTVKAAYDQLREEWTLSRAAVMEHHDPAGVDQPENGLFSDSEQWYALVAYPALEQLPDVRAPAMPAGEWQYVGLGEPANAASEKEDERAETNSEYI